MTPSGEIKLFCCSPTTKKKICSQRAFVSELIRLLLKVNYKIFSQLDAKPYSRVNSRKWKQKYLNQRILTSRDVSSDPRIVVHVDSMIAPSRRRKARIKQNHRLSCWTLQYQTKAEDCSRLCALARNIAFGEQRALVLLWSLVNVRVHLLLIGQSSFGGLWNRMPSKESEHILTIINL